MNRITRRLAAALGVMALSILGATSVGTSSAQAETWGVGGQICNAGSSNSSLRITYNYGDPWNHDSFLSPGSCSPSMFSADADGFYVSSYCSAAIYRDGPNPRWQEVGSGWYKVYDFSSVLVDYDC